MKINSYPVSGENIEITVGNTFLELAVINLGNGFALVETSRNDTDYPVIFINHRTKEAIKDAIPQMSLFGFTIDEPAVTDEDIEQIANYILELEI